MLGENNKRKSPPSPLQNLRATRSKGEVCKICKNNTVFGQISNPNPAVMCTTCSNAFHINCAGVSDNFYLHYVLNKAKPWYCYECEVESREEAKNTVATICKIEKMANTISTELVKLKSADSCWRQEFETRMIEIIDNKISEAQVNQPSNPDVAQPSVSSHLSNAASMSSFRKNVIITCVPINPEENVVSIVKKLAKQINFLQVNFIDNCFRIFRGESRHEHAKPPSILVKFTTEMFRDGFLKCYYNYLKTHHLVAADIGLHGDHRIYVNEHLKPEIQQLLNKTLDLKRRKIVSQVASHYNYISVKITDNERHFWKRIYNETDLVALSDS